MESTVDRQTQNFLQGVAYSYLFLLPTALILLFFSFRFEQVEGRFQSSIDPTRIPKEVINFAVGSTALGALSRVFPSAAGKYLPDSKALIAVGQALISHHEEISQRCSSSDAKKGNNESSQ